MTAARASSWGRAAEQLGVTLSALSQGIAEFERRLGVEVFERQGRRRVPSGHATTVLAHAERVLASTADLARWADRLRRGETGELRVGMIDAAAVHHHAEVLHDFRRQHGDVALHLAVAPSAALLDDLRGGRLDVVVCVEPPEPDPDVELTWLLDEPLAVYAPEDAAALPPERWGPWVMFPAGSHTRAVVEEALRRLGVEIVVVAESHQPEVLREMVRLGVGWAVLPESQAGTASRSLRRARRRPVAVRRLVAARRAAGPAHPAADTLVALLRARGGRRRRTR